VVLGAARVEPLAGVLGLASSVEPLAVVLGARRVERRPVSCSALGAASSR